MIRGKSEKGLLSATDGGVPALNLAPGNQDYDAAYFATMRSREIYETLVVVRIAAPPLPTHSRINHGLI